MSLRSASQPLLRQTFFTPTFCASTSLRSFRATTNTACHELYSTKRRQLHTCHPSQSLFTVVPARQAPRLLPTKTHSPFSKHHESTAAPSHQPSSIPLRESTNNSNIPNGNTTLTWNDFFRLRQRRRYLNVGSSALTSMVSLGGGLGIIAAQDLDTLQLFGLDPIIASALVCIGCVAGGWLAGPFLGAMLFKLLVGKSREIAAKEKDFFARIKRYRIDPSSSSMQNPVPDYYGEKITSVSGYRQWLKDQRAFNRKRESFL